MNVFKGVQRWCEDNFLYPDARNVHLLTNGTTAFSVTWLGPQGNFILHSQCASADYCEVNYLVWFPFNALQRSKTQYFSNVHYALEYVKNFLKL